MLKITLTDGTTQSVQKLVVLDHCTYAMIRNTAYVPENVETLKKYDIVSIEVETPKPTEETPK